VVTYPGCQKTIYATTVVNHENVINARITALQDVHSNWNGSKFLHIYVQKSLMWKVVFSSYSLILFLNFTSPTSVFKYSIFVHTWIVTMNASIHTSSSLTVPIKTVYVKHKMMSSIQKLQEKLNTKETLMTSWCSNWRLHSICLKVHPVRHTPTLNYCTRRDKA
jgi:hypothetical protein